MRCASLACLLLLLAAGCARPAEPSGPEPPARAFDDARAWADLEALAARGPRPVGSDAAAQERAWLRSELDALGLFTQEAQIEVTDAPAPDAPSPGPATYRVLLGEIPGRFPSLVVVAAPSDAPEPASCDSASGAALVLELARAIAREPLPFTTWVVFVEGGEAAPAIAGRAWAAQLAQAGDLQRVRAAVFFRRVAGADVRIARDLFSQRSLREDFWRAAQQRGASETFPPAAGFTPTDGLQHAFHSMGMRRVVAIVGEPESEAAAQPASTCSRESLARVGEVSLAGLDALSERLAKVETLLPAPPASPEPSAEPGVSESTPEAPSPADDASATHAPGVE